MTSTTIGATKHTATATQASSKIRHTSPSVHFERSSPQSDLPEQSSRSSKSSSRCSRCTPKRNQSVKESPTNFPDSYSYPSQIPPPNQPPLPQFLPHPQPYSMCPQFPPPHMTPPFFAMPPRPGPGIPRPHPMAPAQPLHDLGFGPTPLFGWASVTPRAHTYGQPKFWRYTKPDYRRFCFSVGKADVPYASLPGGPLEGFPAHMAPQLVGRW